MRRKLTLIADLERVLDNGIVCLLHENHTRKDTEPHYEFGYLSGAINYIRKETSEKELFVSSSRTVYDLLENKLLEQPAFQGFFGEIYHVANVGSPTYFDYFVGLLSEDYKIDFNMPMFDKNGKQLFLEDYNSNSDFPFAIKKEIGVDFVDEQGFNNRGQMVVSNFHIDEIKNLFTEEEGYLILGEGSGPIYLSKEAYERFNASTLEIESIGLKKEERYKIHPVLNVCYQDTVIDTLLLDNQLQENKLTSNRLVFNTLFRDSDEEVEFESFETDSDIWDDSFDMTSNEGNFESDKENIFLKAAEEMLGAPITFEADYSIPDNWEEDEAIDNMDLEEDLIEDVKNDTITDNDEPEDWDDEIDLDDEED